MSLSMSSSSSSSSSSSLSAQNNDARETRENNIPRFPERREDFSEYVMRIEAYLDARELLEVVVRGVKGIPKDKVGTMDTAVIEATKLDSNATRLTKSKQASNIIIQSLPSKMIKIVSGVNVSNAYEMWNVLKRTQGLIKTTDTSNALLEQLHNIKRKSDETITNYIARIELIIHELHILNIDIKYEQKKFYIMKGLDEDKEWEMDMKILRKWTPTAKCQSKNWNNT